MPAWGYAGLSASIINGHTISYEGERAELATIPSSQVTAQLGLRFLEDKLTVGGEVQYNGKPKGNPDRQGLYAGQRLRQLSGDRQSEG